MQRLVLSALLLSAFPLGSMGQEVVDGHWTYIVEDGVATITASTEAGAVAIPSVLGGYSVEQVGLDSGVNEPSIFGSGNGKQNNSVTSISIPDSVTRIGQNAFTSCTSLASITMPESVTSIGDWAFSSCSALTGVVIPNNVTSIGVQAFVECYSLTSISIPSSVISIGGDAFTACTSLATVYLPTRFADTYITFGLTASQVIFVSTLTATCDTSTGTVLADPNKDTYEAGESVVVTATPNAGYLFSNWFGDVIATTSSITLTMDTDKAVRANFIQDVGDNDGDGLTNYQESITYGTNPNVAETVSPVVGLYLANQMQAMAIGELVLTKDANGAFTLNYDIEKSEDLQTWTTYAPHSLTLSNLPPGKAFIRIKAKP
ncbi:MAG: leucine-rich repeat protein [Verrucomicrobia bacterium]|nr:leucine-rich repeat protein [Verrucomicrobiota bacterium]